LIVSGLLVLSVLVVIVGERGAEVEAGTPRSGLIVLAMASLALFTIGFAAIGFTVPALVLLVLWFRWLGREPWWLSVLLAVVCVGVLYGVFAIALGVPFPPDLVVPTS
jgi:apolipoprotein N-acyltransferase